MRIIGWEDDEVVIEDEGALSQFLVNFMNSSVAKSRIERLMVLAPDRS
jgi:hypothetical protein